MSTSKKNMLSFELCEGQRKGSLLLYVPEEKQLYKFKSNDGHLRRYVCYKRYCKATAVIDTRWVDKRQCRVALSECHVCHRTQEGSREFLRLSSAIKKKSANPNLNRTHLREVFEAECRKDPLSAKYLSFPSIQRQLLNIRNQSFPNDPKSSKEVEELFKDKEIMKNFGKSRANTGASFYSTTVTDSKLSYTIFISPTIAEQIDEISPSDVSRRYYLDTRFKVPNSSYRNFLIVHMEYMEQVFPLMYVMMSSRKKDTYSHVFRHINENIFKMLPRCFMHDKDDELEQSLSLVFPGIPHGVTWFHYCQEVRRRAKTIKYFPRAVRLDNNARTLFQKFLALPLVKTRCIREAFGVLRSEINDNENLRAHRELFKAFIVYVYREWLQKSVPIDNSLKAIRISRQLEDFNTRINKKLMQFSGFFKSISFLLDEDDRMSARFSEFFSKLRQPLSHDGPNDCNYRIANAAAEVNDGEIYIRKFFKEVTKRKNDIQLILDEGFNDAEHNEDVEYNDQIVEQPALCIICLSAPRSLLIYPCMHFKLCEECYKSIEKEHENNFTETSCPVCRKIVTKTAKIYS